MQPYAGRANSVFAGCRFAWEYVEDFEAGELIVPGVVLEGGDLEGGEDVDSVDEDDGALDGVANGGHSYLGEVVIARFSSPPLPALPTHVAIVWTDSAPNVRVQFEAFDRDGQPVAPAVGVEAGLPDDTQLAAAHPGGISEIRVSSRSGDVVQAQEVDHLFIGFDNCPALDNGQADADLDAVGDACDDGSVGRCPERWVPQTAVWVVADGRARVVTPEAFSPRLEVGEVPRPAGERFVDGVALPGGLRALLRTERRVHLTDLVSGQILASADAGGPIAAVSLAPAGDRVAVLVGEDLAREVTAFEVDGLVPLDLDSSEFAERLELPGAQAIALADGGRLFVNGVVEGELTGFSLLADVPEAPATVYLRDGEPGPLALSPDGATLFAGWDDFVLRHRVTPDGLEAAGTLVLVQGANGFFPNRRVEALAPIDADTTYALFFAANAAAYEELHRVDFSGAPQTVWRSVIANRLFPRRFALSLLGRDAVTANPFRDEREPERVAVHDAGDGTPRVEGVFPGVTGIFAAGPLDLERCSGIDDDCDGVTDEGFDVGGACDEPGRCGAGEIECREGAAYCTTRDRAEAEICNGEDDDCDGVTDEDVPAMIGGSLVVSGNLADQPRVTWAAGPSRFGVVWRDQGDGQPGVRFRRYSTQLAVVDDAPLELDNDGNVLGSGPDVAWTADTWAIGYVGAGGNPLPFVKLDDNLAQVAMVDARPVVPDPQNGPVTLTVVADHFARGLTLSEETFLLSAFEVGPRRDQVGGISPGGGYRGRPAMTNVRGLITSVVERDATLVLHRETAGGESDPVIDLHVPAGREPAITHDLALGRTVVAWTDDAGVHAAVLGANLDGLSEIRHAIGPPGASSPTLAVGAFEYLLVYVYEDRLWAARFGRLDPNLLRVGGALTPPDVAASEPHLASTGDVYGLVWTQRQGLNPSAVRITSDPLGCGFQGE